LYLADGLQGLVEIDVFRACVDPTEYDPNRSALRIPRLPAKLPFRTAKREIIDYHLRRPAECGHRIHDSPDHCRSSN
jgi:hypothetical protein